MRNLRVMKILCLSGKEGLNYAYPLEVWLDFMMQGQPRHFFVFFFLVLFIAASLYLCESLDVGGYSNVKNGGMVLNYSFLGEFGES
jgi:hypothetical protein